MCIYFITIKSKKREVTLKEKKADTEWHNDKHPYQILIDSFNDAVYIIDRNFRVIFINSALRQWIKDCKFETIDRRVVEAFPFLPKRVFDRYQQPMLKF